MMKEHYEKMLPGARLWTGDMEVEMDAIEQIRNVTKLPILAGPVAVMPDVHLGKGATVGTVIPTRAAIVPAAVGVDIGCGMLAVKNRPHGERPAREPQQGARADRARCPGGIQTSTRSRWIRRERAKRCRSRTA